ncbi:hypothetical protein [Streptomyces sp. NPDC101115]|uniref:hypothetical protein n=1 Tax=Streptomyces sp. NPDC101115 TaxID=3366106 RepID=UPI003820CB7F
MSPCPGPGADDVPYGIEPGGYGRPGVPTARRRASSATAPTVSAQPSSMMPSCPSVEPGRHTVSRFGDAGSQTCTIVTVHDHTLTGG